MGLLWLLVRIAMIVGLSALALLAYERARTGPSPRCESATGGSIIRTMNCR